MNALRLALGTLTVLPVRPPAPVDRGTAGWAMALAPLVGLLLAVPCATLLWVLPEHTPLLSAALVLALLALLTRAIHLDGLADTVDGLGSAKPADQALVIMRKGDVGPFGVIALVLVLVTQVAALAHLLATRHGAAALVLALMVSRLMLPIACLRGIPAARADGLGHSVARSVRALQLTASLALPVLLGLVAYGGLDAGLLPGIGATVIATVLSLAGGMLLGARCVRRFGGITGDVLGAAVEVTFTVALVVLALS